MKNTILLLLTMLFLSNAGFAQDLTAREIIDKANKKSQGDYHQGEIKMSIIRPDWDEGNEDEIMGKWR